MKKFLLMLSIPLFINAHAQKWLAPQAHWQFNVSFFSSQRIDSAHLAGDTVIGGTLCQAIYEVGDTHYTYQSNDTVFFWKKGHFRPTLFWNAVQGDTIRIFVDINQNHCFPADSLQPFKVDTLFFLSANGVLLKTHKLKAASLLNFYPDYPLMYSERIGFWNSPYPKFGCVTDAPEYSLCNYSDSVITALYPQKACIYNGIEDITSTNIVVAPNPANNSTTISSLQHHFHYGLTDVVGSVLNEGEADKEVTLQLATLPPGIYIVKVGNEVQRVVKE